MLGRPVRIAIRGRVRAFSRALSSPSLVLHSSNEVDQASSITARRRGWASPDPGIRALVQLPGGDPGGQVDLRLIGEGLPGECRPPKGSPPGFLEIQPAGAFRDENRVHARVLSEPLPDRRALVAAEVV